MELREKVAITTGGGSGIGQNISLLFAKQRARTIVVDINLQKGKETAESISSAREERVFIKADVSLSKDIRKMIEGTTSQYKKLDILVNNAGIAIEFPKKDTILETTEEEWDVVDTKLKRVFCAANTPYLM